MTGVALFILLTDVSDQHLRAPILTLRAAREPRRFAEEWLQIELECDQSGQLVCRRSPQVAAHPL